MRLGRRPSSAAPYLLAVVTTLSAAACGTSPSAPPFSPQATPLPTAQADAVVSNATPGPSMSVDPRSRPDADANAGCTAVSVLPWHLDIGLSRAVAFADSGTIVVAGGLTAKGTTGDVRRIDVATGRTTDIGHLRRTVHDASGAVIGDRLLVFGGGDTVAGSAVQVAALGATGQVIGSLPAVRADLSAVVLGDRVFLIGGGSAKIHRSTDLGDQPWQDRTARRSIADRCPICRDRRLGCFDLRFSVARLRQGIGERGAAVRHRDRTDHPGRPAARAISPTPQRWSWTAESGRLVGTSSDAIWSFDPDGSGPSRGSDAFPARFRTLRPWSSAVADT